MKHRFLTVVAVLLVLAPSTASSADEPVFVDPDTARWQVEHIDATFSTFYFGLPGDVPLFGDWDCDGDFSTGDLVANTAGQKHAAILEEAREDVHLAFAASGAFYNEWYSVV